jgi:hypothetical protein
VDPLRSDFVVPVIWMTNNNALNYSCKD